MRGVGAGAALGGGILLVQQGVLWRFKLPEPVVVLASGAIGLALWPLVRPAG